MKNDKEVYILLADDDDDDTTLFQEALRLISMDIHLEIAENGLILMNKLEEGDTRPDLVFLDINMPVKNGLECLDEIRQQEHFNETPVVMLSTSVADDYLKSSFNAGANLYIQKPNSFNRLVEIIEKCVKNLDALKNSIPIDSFLVKS